MMESLWPGLRRIDLRFPVNIRVMGDSTISCVRVVLTFWPRPTSFQPSSLLTLSTLTWTSSFSGIPFRI